MRILHTGDWHLGDRLGRIDRTDDIRRNVERIAEYCRDESVDVLLIAGDLFSELARQDTLRDAIRHLQDTYGEFLSGGGTILAVTGNHDNENFCQTLCHAMNLAAVPTDADGRAATGRLHLATEPMLLRLPDRREQFDVQFLLMPYPTPTRYLRTEAQQRFASLDEKNRTLLAAFTDQLSDLQQGPAYASSRPTVLCAHVSVQGGELSNRFRMDAEEDLVLSGSGIQGNYAYIALGHIHKPQSLGGLDHVRYSGSIERLDMGEKNDQKSVVLIDVGPTGLRGSPELLPLEATSIYQIDVTNPADEIEGLRDRFAGAERDLVRLHIRYTSGVDNLNDVLSKLDEIFPRWYQRDWHDTSGLGQPMTTADDERAKSFEETVRDYINAELLNYEPDEREAVLKLADDLMRQMAEQS
jgi:exonuclease SbcD